MTFNKEEEMYEIIGEYFAKNGYRTLINKITFDLLSKGWKIDVVGIKKEKNKPELIAVEAKKDLKPERIVQAISQAEIYKSAFNKVYVAFPKSDLESEDNKEFVGEIEDLCKAKGVGILEVGKTCQESQERLSATPSYLKVDIYQGIINQIEPTEFEGFELEDFVRHYNSDHDPVVFKTFSLLIEELEKRLKSKGLVLTHGPASALTEVPDENYTSERFWATFSDIRLKDEDYVNVPSFVIKWRGHGVMVELISGPSSYLDAFKEKLKNDDTKFYEILRQIKEESYYYYNIKVQEGRKIERRSYELTPPTSIEYILHSEYLTTNNYQEFVRFLREERKKKICLVISCFFHIKGWYSEDLVSSIESAIGDLMELYRHIIQKETK